MIIGYDHLGAAHPLWPIKTATKETPKSAAIGLLDYTFGDAEAVFKRYVKAGFKVFRVHFWWADSHVIAPLSRVKTASKKWEKIAKAHPEAKIYVSHSLEHNEKSVAAVLRRLDLMRELAPSCTPVNCVWKGVTVAGEINEVHEEYEGPTEHLNTSAYLYSSDGVSILAIPMKALKKKHKDAAILFGWIPRFNLRTDSGPQPPPKLRKAVPTAQEFKEVVKHMEG